MKKWKKISNIEVYDCNGFYRVEKDQIITPSGKNGQYSVVKSDGFSVIIPIDKKGYVYMVKQHRYTIDEISLEFPSGGIEKGETPLMSAKRELEEETSLVAKKWFRKDYFYEANGLANIKGWVFLACDVEKTEFPQKDILDEELIELEKYSVQEIKEMISSGQINDSATICAFSIALLKGDLRKYEKNNFKLVIFDFDGTIADSFEICLDAINKALKERGQTEITKEERLMAKNLPAREVFRYFKVPGYKIPLVVKTILTEMSKNFIKVKIFLGMKSVLKIFGKSKLKIILLTSNRRKNVEAFLERENLREIFDDIYFRSGIFSKHLFIDKLIKKYKVKSNDILMIGDEVRDIEAARKSGIKIATVTWGYNKKAFLKGTTQTICLKNLGKSLT